MKKLLLYTAAFLIALPTFAQNGKKAEQEVLALDAQMNSSHEEEVANKAMVRRYFEEIVNQQKPELVREVVAEDYFFHSLEDGSEGGIRELEEFLPYFFKAFPDIHYTIDQMVAEGDQVVVQVTAQWTQKGEFWGYPPSNNKLNISEVFFYTLKDGKIIGNRRLADLYHLDKQLSAVSE